MSKRVWHPPFVVEVMYYDKDGKSLEWIEEWGECKEAVKIQYEVLDHHDQTLSTHNDRIKAVAACERANNEYGKI